MRATYPANVIVDLSYVINDEVPLCFVAIGRSN